MNCEDCGACCQFIFIDYAGISQEDAEWLKLHGVKLIGTKMAIPCKCFLYDEKTKKCRDYESRPDTCRFFRAGGPYCRLSRIAMDLKSLSVIKSL